MKVGWDLSLGHQGPLGIYHHMLKKQIILNFNFSPYTRNIMVYILGYPVNLCDVMQ